MSINVRRELTGSVLNVFVSVVLIATLKRKNNYFSKLFKDLMIDIVFIFFQNGYAPVEFFLEGTRSRTAKSLTPKLGKKKTTKGAEEMKSYSPNVMACVLGKVC